MFYPGLLVSSLQMLTFFFLSRIKICIMINGENSVMCLRIQVPEILTRIMMTWLQTGSDVCVRYMYTHIF